MRSFAWLGAVFGLVVLTGCGSGLPDLYEAKGTVTYKGAPVAGAQVMLTSENSPMCTAITDDKGEFVLKTSGELGVATGMYKVTITKMEGGIADPTKADPAMMIKMAQEGSRGQINTQSKNVLPTKYASFEESGLTADVTTDASKNVFTYELVD